MENTIKLTEKQADRAYNLLSEFQDRLEKELKKPTEKQNMPNINLYNYQINKLAVMIQEGWMK